MPFKPREINLQVHPLEPKDGWRDQTKEEGTLHFTDDRKGPGSVWVAFRDRGIPWGKQLPAGFCWITRAGIPRLEMGVTFLLHPSTLGAAKASEQGPP